MASIIFSVPAFCQFDNDEPNLLKDIVQSDDVIIIGNACTGFSCLNGEAFGSDTHRFKQQVVRLHFDDTSTASGFPNNDWRILINDTGSGGDNYFAVEDATAGRTPFLIEAGAPNSSLYVDSGGRIGLGTANPVVEMHVVDGDSPTLRLEQDNSNGFSPQTWDLAGNETNFFIRDVSNGATLPFRIRPSAPTNSVFIDSNGNVGIGTSAPEVELHVAGDIGKTGSIVGISDKRVKSNISPIMNAMSILLLLDGKSFEYQTDKFEGLKLPDGAQYGLIAQDVEKVLPQIVRKDFLKWNDSGQTLNLKGIYYEQLIPVLINALKEQNGELNELRTANKAILKRLEVLESQISGED